MGAGPSPAAVSRAMKKAEKQCREYRNRNPGSTASPHFMQASNGEACIAYKVNGEIVLSLPQE